MCSQVRKCVLILFVGLAGVALFAGRAESAGKAGATITHEVIAGTGAHFQGLGRGPSINDNGFIAFVGESRNGSGEPADNIYAFNPNMGSAVALMNQVFMYPNSGSSSLTAGTP